MQQGFKNVLYNYFVGTRGMEPYRRGWLKGDCPECGATFKYGVNISSNRTNCFKCGYNDRPLDVVMKIENTNTLRELLELLNNKDLQLEYKEPKIEILEEKPVNHPEGFHLIIDGKGTKAKLARRYLENRGFEWVHYITLYVGR